MNERQLYAKYRIRPRQYPYVNTVFMHQGASNLELAAILGVSRQIVGRVTSMLESKQIIRDLNPSSASNAKKKWQVCDEAAEDFKEFLGSERQGAYPYGNRQRTYSSPGIDDRVRAILNGPLRRG